MREEHHRGGDAHRDHDDDQPDRDLESACERPPHDRDTAWHRPPNALQLSPQCIDARVCLVLLPVILHLLHPTRLRSPLLWSAPSVRWNRQTTPSRQPGVLLSETPLAAEVGNNRYVYTYRLFPTSAAKGRSEEHTSELQSRPHLVCRLLLEKKKTTKHTT